MCSLMPRLPLLLWLSVLATPAFAAEPTDREIIDRDMASLAKQLDALRVGVGPERADLKADVAVFLKGARWALDYEAKLAPGDLALIKKALQTGLSRARVLKYALGYEAKFAPGDLALIKKTLETGLAHAEALHSGQPAWNQRRGKVVRGYVSAVDGSVQPYGVIVPRGYDPAKPIRLDVVLHGSSKPTGLSELRFMSRFNDGDLPETNPPDENHIELHPLGRVENCYRWAGETDVFEAIEAVCRQYAIDRDRIVLRGMSMGASGTWHLGLKHPDRFVALGPYCGYVDTHLFSQTPIASFVKVGPLPAHQEAGLHMLDSVDYAANAGAVPAIACMGEKDVFFEAHEIMGRAMAKEGLKMVNLISPGTGHVIDPITFKEQMRRIGGYAGRGLQHVPRKIRFVTWTLKYAECHWVRVLALGEHYQRAELKAEIGADGVVEIEEPTNITRFALTKPVWKGKARSVSVGKTFLKIPDGLDNPVIGLSEGRWIVLGELGRVEPTGKQPGLQGPIDDAFASPFLCVRGTGKAWNPRVQSWSEGNLKRFQAEWRRFFRGDLPVKDDKDVTADDIKNHHLILFGDPSSNSLIQRVLPKLPIRWTATELEMAGRVHPASEHGPVLIQPNPLAANKYVVINSGHTFHEKELDLLNYLLFPRLGDWAVMKLDEKAGEEPVRAGYFDEAWKFKK